VSEQPLLLPQEAETSRTVEALGTTLHYHDVGSGPPVVLLHSWGIGTTAWLTWHKTIPVLARHFRCLALDLPNFAKSGPLYTDESIHEMQATSALALMDALRLERVHLVANSQGSQSALLLAAEHPQRIDRFVIGAHHLGLPGPEYLLTVEDEEGIRLGSLALEQPSADNVRAYLASHLDDKSLISQELIAYLLAQHNARADIAAARDAMAYGGRHPEPAQLGSFDRPTLVIWGRNDRTCHWEIGIRTMNLFPRSRLIVLRDTGHWPPFEKPAEYASHVANFLTADWG
jgi:pimeloyl-ACP methyl ester carboxylesterase